MADDTYADFLRALKFEQIWFDTDFLGGYSLDHAMFVDADGTQYSVGRNLIEAVVQRGCALPELQKAMDDFSSADKKNAALMAEMDRRNAKTKKED